MCWVVGLDCFTIDCIYSLNFRFLFTYRFKVRCFFPLSEWAYYISRILALDLPAMKNHIPGAAPYRYTLSAGKETLRRRQIILQHRYLLHLKFF